MCNKDSNKIFFVREVCRFAIRTVKGASRCIDNFVSKAIRLKKKKASWIRDALRFLGARSSFEGQSNGVKSPRVATRNVMKPWKRAGRASALYFPLRILLLCSSFFIFLDFRPSKLRVFPLLDFQYRNLATSA